MISTLFKQKFTFYIGSLLASILLLSCARSFNPDIERGGEFEYREGYPEARFSAIGFVDEELGPIINASVEVVYGSLVYRSKNSDTLRADVSFNIRIQDVENPDETVRDVNFTKHITSEDPDIVNNQQTLILEEQIKVDPGDYRVVLTVRDLNSNKETIRTTQTYIPDLKEGDEYTLSNIKLFGKETGNGKGWIPITTYDVKGRIDSLRFVFQVISKPTDDPLTVSTRLVGFESDTTPARTMYHNTPSASSIDYKGIDYDKETEIQSNERVLTNYASVMIEFKFPQFGRGNYRFAVNTENNSGSYYKARDFSVKSKNYPAIQSPLELARPLVYIMDSKEHEQLMAIENEDSMKAEIDRFWLRNIQSSSKAKNVIKMYYERVEQANKQFSNFQEGWKTDRGFLYILFGPPWYVERRVDVLQWSYNYNRQDPEYNFIFRLPKMKNEFFPFNNYVLQRNHYYYNTQYQQTQLWKSGRILTRQIY